MGRVQITRPTSSSAWCCPLPGRTRTNSRESPVHDGVQYFDHGLLHDLVLQGGNRDWSLFRRGGVPEFRAAFCARSEWRSRPVTFRVCRAARAAASAAAAMASSDDDAVTWEEVMERTEW